MIYYFVTERQAGPMRHFLETWGRALAGRVAVVTYEMLLAGRVDVPEQGGAYIFTNFGNVRAMAPDAQSAIRALHKRLLEQNGVARVLNDPDKSLLRYDLLRMLHERGVNSFNAFRTDEPADGLRYPCFIRHEREARFDNPVLAQDPQQYGALLNGLTWQQGTRAGFITVEFCDVVSSDGFYRKYGAFVIGDRIVPRHVHVGRKWFLRTVDLSGPSEMAEEKVYVATNPHKDMLLECARAAGISYGRFDYGLLGGRPQIWEININAAFYSYEPSIPERVPPLERFAAKYAEAMIALDPQG
jgi:hypothetical protein